MIKDYTTKYSKRKSLSLEITKNQEIIVRAPNNYPKYLIKKFVNQNEKWIEKSLEKQSQRIYPKSMTDSEKKEMKALAKEKIPPRVEFYSSLMNLKPTSVKITSAEKRFGSCSYNNRLCFSYRLMQYPQEEIDYVIVHELAHIKHKNHQKEFYKLIETYLPDYKHRQGVLKIL